MTEKDYLTRILGTINIGIGAYLLVSACQLYSDVKDLGDTFERLGDSTRRLEAISEETLKDLKSRSESK